MPPRPAALREIDEIVDYFAAEARFTVWSFWNAAKWIALALAIGLSITILITWMIHR